ncbi:glycosyltransferase [Mycobacterium sp.]|jgi:UDP:flavonoid glycosyltransferase YjiC (YdhE family)|uniref:glycosyltransferase n=1 Tax=Mycobacterium sp. TaxID=1785 RepID=UPI002CE77B38|nr:glycosyltransferase [Mycobacterium sp.]HXB87184.1 glycosyltransferase [Mycobacterium sp.]
MKFVVAGYGSRGDVEPCVAVGRELLRRGHEVRMAVPPNMLGFAEAAGLAAVAYGPNSRLVEGFREDFAKIENPITKVREATEHYTHVWAEKGMTLTELADGADLLVAGITEQGLAANVAEFHGIPLAALHMYPMRIIKLQGLDWRLTQEAESAHRRALGLPEATGASAQLMEEGGSLEIQAYDEFCLPGPTAEWVEPGGWRPFVGALTLELPTAADDEILSWIAAGPPPIYFGFGSMKVTMPADTIAMISAACAQLGERALIESGSNDFSHIPQADHVKIVDTVGQVAVFPACRAIVHHGGSGTTAAALRAGIPTLILFAFWLDQPIWAVAVEQLKVGSCRHFSTTTQESLVAILSEILAPQYHARAREVAAQMTKPAESLARAADLLEDAARQGRSA